MNKIPVLKEGIATTPTVIEDHHGGGGGDVLRGAGDIPSMLMAPARAALDAWPAISDRNTVFTSARRYVEIKLWANRIAKELEKKGEFPGLYEIADQALLVLRNCSNIIVENVHFQDCWPTAIYIENCTDIVIRNCSFAGGTFAVCARGPSTRGITIENCFWQQDDENADRRTWEKDEAGANGPAIWDGMNWQHVHGDIVDYNYPVDVDNDHRGWGIAGDVVIRGNHVRNAFNAVHTFGQDGDLPPVTCRNVMVEGNLFARIRDNTIEPEPGAVNWVVRHNRFLDNFRPFSIEGTNTGYIYIFGNEGWNLSKPGMNSDDKNTGASLFKFTSKSESDGPVVFVHNSFVIFRDFAKKFGVAQWLVANNAIFQAGGSSFFGKGWKSTDVPHDESTALTRRWEELGIEFKGNIFRAKLDRPFVRCHYPDRLRRAGYDRIPDAERCGDPKFTRPPSGDYPSDADLRPGARSPLPNSSVPMEIVFPGGVTRTVSGGNHVGARQEDGELFDLPADFPAIEAFVGV